MFTRLYSPGVRSASTGATRVLITNPSRRGIIERVVLKSTVHHDLFYVNNTTFGRFYVEGEDAHAFYVVPCGLHRDIEDGEEFLVTDEFFGEPRPEPPPKPVHFDKEITGIFHTREYSSLPALTLLMQVNFAETYDTDLWMFWARCEAQRRLELAAWAENPKRDVLEVSSAYPPVTGEFILEDMRRLQDAQDEQGDEESLEMLKPFGSVCRAIREVITTLHATGEVLFALLDSVRPPSLVGESHLVPEWLQDGKTARETQRVPLAEMIPGWLANSRDPIGFLVVNTDRLIMELRVGDKKLVRCIECGNIFAIKPDEECVCSDRCRERINYFRGLETRTASDPPGTP